MFRVRVNAFRFCAYALALCVVRFAFDGLGFVYGCLLFVLIPGYVDLWYNTRRSFRMEVCNGEFYRKYNDLRDLFRIYALSTPMPEHIPGCHNILAAERKMAEGFFIKYVLPGDQKFRDVGGSRSRHQDLGERKHVCTPNLSAADIYRDDKVPAGSYGFDFCREKGSNCPRLNDIPYAMLSHVDYYCDVDELSAIVCGPTVIINHDFDSQQYLGQYYKEVPASTGGSNRRLAWECRAKVRGSTVVMEPDGGTPYGPHRYHHWKNEGCVVGKNGAFIYARLGNIGTTQVLFAYPAAGEYGSNDPNALQSATPLFQHGNVEVFREADELLLDDGEHRDKLPYGLVESCALAVCTSERDDKYFGHVRSYLFAKTASINKNIVHSDALLQYVMDRADNLAIDILPNAHLGMQGPARLSVFQVIWWKCYRGLNARLKKFQLDDWVVTRLSKYCRPLMPWKFHKRFIPAYVVEYPFTSVDVNDLPRTDRPFLNEHPGVNAGPYGCCNSRSGKNIIKHANVTGNAGGSKGVQNAPIPRETGEKLGGKESDCVRSESRSSIGLEENKEDHHGVGLPIGSDLDDQRRGSETSTGSFKSRSTSVSRNDERSESSVRSVKRILFGHVDVTKGVGTIRTCSLTLRRRKPNHCDAELVLPNGNTIWGFWKDAQSWACEECIPSYIREILARGPTRKNVEVFGLNKFRQYQCEGLCNHQNGT